MRAVTAVVATALAMLVVGGCAGQGSTGPAGQGSTGPAGQGSTGPAGQGSTGPAGQGSTGPAGQGSTGPAGHGSTGPAGHAAPTPCAASALALQPSAPVSPMTGEHAVMYALTNRGPVTCTVRGYPQAVLYGASGDALPFSYAAGGGAYVTSGKPVTVVLAHGARAYILVAKYRCDLGIARNATAIRLTLPAAHGGTFTQREAVGVSGLASLAYCRGGPHDPGQQVTLSPVEPTRQATSSLR